MSYNARNPYERRYSGSGVETAGRVVGRRLAVPCAPRTRHNTHWCFEGRTEPVCPRRGWSRVPRTTRDTAAVTCHDCLAVVAKAVRR